MTIRIIKKIIIMIINNLPPKYFWRFLNFVKTSVVQNLFGYFGINEIILNCLFGIHVIMNTSSFNSGSSPTCWITGACTELTHLKNNCQFYVDLNLHYLNINLVFA